MVSTLSDLVVNLQDRFTHNAAHLVSVNEQAALCLPWLETPKTGFLVTLETGLIWYD